MKAGKIWGQTELMITQMNSVLEFHTKQNIKKCCVFSTQT